MEEKGARSVLPKFPPREEELLSLFVQGRWPGSNQHIFCLRESRVPEDVVVDGELERMPVVALQRYGRRLSIAACSDRP